MQWKGSEEMVAGVFLEFFEGRDRGRKVRRFWLDQVTEKGFEF